MFLNGSNMIVLHIAFTMFCRCSQWILEQQQFESAHTEQKTSTRKTNKSEDEEVSKLERRCFREEVLIGMVKKPSAAFKRVSREMQVGPLTSNSHVTATNLIF